MLLWRLLIDGAKTNNVGRDREKALAWIYRHLPELVPFGSDEHGARVPSQEQFNWEIEWPNWQRNLCAIQWLADCRDSVVEPRSLADQIPLQVQRVIDEALLRTTNVI